MHILAGILLIAGVAIFWMWRIRNASILFREAVYAVEEAFLALRRFGFRRKVNRNPLDHVADPRVAAAGILAAFANMDSALCQEEIAGIERVCRRAFSCGAEEARDLGIHGRWLIQNSEANMGEVIRRLTRSLAGRLDPAEKRQLAEMVAEVARIESGRISPSQQAALDQMVRRLS